VVVDIRLNQTEIFDFVTQILSLSVQVVKVGLQD
jgi:hypothetical protein